MSTITYGTIPTTAKNTKVTYTSQLTNGTSSTNTGGQIVVQYDCLWADIGSLTPAPFTAFSGNPNYLLVNASQEQLLLGMGRLTLTFQASYTSTPATEYTEQGGISEANIQEHPDFNTWISNGWVVYDDQGAFAGFTQDSGVPQGTESYKVGTRCVTKKEYFTSEPTDEFATISTISSPGRDYADDGTWLVISTVRALEGIFWTRTTVYQYSSLPWNTNIYSS